MTRCIGCPVAAEKRWDPFCVPGEAKVGFGRDGRMEYAYVSAADPQNDADIGIVCRRDMEVSLTEIAEAVNECVLPITRKVPMTGLLGLLGMTKTQTECPVAEEFDLRSAESLKQFLGRVPPKR